ncbi:MAG: hypothetical protein WBA44_11580 [Mesorhizobium sp.]
MTPDLPRGVIVPVADIDVRLAPEIHPFEVANLPAIAANWQVEHAANPALFNGRTVLSSTFALDGDRLVGIAHPVQYATLLYWRKNRREPGVEHWFGFPALVSRDNALIAIRMGRHTANPGRVYFAAGSLEPGDFVDGQADLHANMVREVREETGLDISGVRADANAHLLSKDHATVVFRRFYLEEDAEAVARRIEAFVAAESEPEIDGPVIIRSADDLPDGLSHQMDAIIRWHFLGERTPG